MSAALQETSAQVAKRHERQRQLHGPPSGEEQRIEELELVLAQARGHVAELEAVMVTPWCTECGGFQEQTDEDGCCLACGEDVVCQWHERLDKLSDNVRLAILDKTKLVGLAAQQERDAAMSDQRIVELERQNGALHESTADLHALRADGWVVAVHNDYEQDGERRTFWGFSRGAQWIRGEGRTDAEACAEAINAVASLVEAD